jgi:hypothetical protein
VWVTGDGVTGNPWFDVADRAPQELDIRARGRDVLRLEPYAPPDDEAPRPDLGALIVRAARAGLLGGAGAAPWSAAAKVLDARFDLDERRASWRLLLDGVDPGAYRIIRNLLGAMDLDEAVIATAEIPGTRPDATPRLDLGKLAYPAVFRRLPFRLEVEPPLRSNNRSVQIVFASRPPDAVADATLAACDLWSELVVRGGYPEDGVHPSRSGAMPDPPFMFDEVTIEQAFPDLFAADDAAFNAIVNHAAAVHHAGVAVSEVLVR